MKIKQWMKLRGMMLALALLMAVGTPLYVMQTPVEVSAKSLKSGLKKEKGNFYYYKKGVKVRNKWMTINKKKYYFQSDGTAATGWVQISKKAYYFTSNAVMAKNTQVDGVKLNSKGWVSLTNSRVKLIFKTKLVVAKLTKKSRSDEEKLEACYAEMLKYKATGKFEAVNSSGWEVKSAYNMLVSRKGSCYGFAAAFSMLARECGYNARIVMGKITRNDGRTTVNHAWVEIEGRVYDPQTQQTTGVNLYGKKYSEITSVSYESMKIVS